MGISNPGTSSSDFLPFAELERALAALVDECYPEPEPSLFNSQSLNYVVVKNKISYYQQVFEKINETKENFITFYAAVYNRIQELIREIITLSKEREKQLKKELELIANAKLSEYNKQLIICEKTLKDLKRYQENPASTSREASSFESVFNANNIRQIEFVDAGKIHFEADNLQDVIRHLQCLGTINCHCEIYSTAFNDQSLGLITPKFTFGNDGVNPGQFCRPWGVSSDPTGRILVADRSNHRIQIFNEHGQFLLQFGKEGSGPGEFNRPTGITVNHKCNIIVADKDNHRIQVFTYSGLFLFAFGSQGTRPAQFNYPWDVAVNSYGDIAVSDSKNHRIQLFNEKGIFITHFDGKKMGHRDPHAMLRFLDSPRGLAFHPDGGLLVTDFNNHRIIFINKYFSRYKFFGSEGSNEGQFFRPQGISCDNTGKFAVADSKNYRVQIFNNEQTLIKCFGSQGREPGQFDCPQGICIHPNQNVLVVDFNNNRVQIF